LATTACAAAGLATVTAAASITDASTTLGPNIGGQTISPGIYKSTTFDLGTAGGSVTLSGEGVFVFISSSTLLAGATTTVLLKDGAQAKNVYWICGSVATIGADTHIEGSILAGSAITFGAGASINGLTYAVTVTFGATTVAERCRA
jgi:hypothetical protein